jgi:ribosomal protein S18 acetylase RimI-like enzyme
LKLKVERGSFSIRKAQRHQRKKQIIESVRDLVSSSYRQLKEIKAMITAKKVTAGDRDAAVAAVVQAFSADPVARWMYPDSQQYLEYFPSFVKAFAGAAFEHGSADCVDGYSAAALWLPPDIHADEEAVFKLLQESVPEREQAEVFGLFEQMDAHHPAEPHWYLPMIGVDPAEQGNGYGSALLKHALARCDADDKLAYLESTSLKSLRLYERHGFELLGTIQVGSSPPLFPMLRKPRSVLLVDKTESQENFSSTGWVQI